MSVEGAKKGFSLPINLIAVTGKKLVAGDENAFESGIRMCRRQSPQKYVIFGRHCVRLIVKTKRLKPPQHNNYVHTTTITPNCPIEHGKTEMPTKFHLGNIPAKKTK